MVELTLKQFKEQYADQYVKKDLLFHPVFKDKGEEVFELFIFENEELSSDQTSGKCVHDITEINGVLQNMSRKPLFRDTCWGLTKYYLKKFFHVTSYMEELAKKLVEEEATGLQIAIVNYDYRDVVIDGFTLMNTLGAKTHNYGSRKSLFANLDKYAKQFECFLIVNNNKVYKIIRENGTED